MSEEAYSIDLEETSVQSGEDSRRSSGGSSVSEQSQASSAWSDVGADLVKAAFSMKKLRDRMQANDLFDDNDVVAVDEEIERVRERERNSFEAKLKERLRILAKFDGYLKFRTHHPDLNAYFVKKQKKMQRLAKAAAKNGSY